jgi:hypothetical protein
MRPGWRSFEGMRSGKVSVARWFGSSYSVGATLTLMDYVHLY